MLAMSVNGDEKEYKDGWCKNYKDKTQGSTSSWFWRNGWTWTSGGSAMWAIGDEKGYEFSMSIKGDAYHMVVVASEACRVGFSIYPPSVEFAAFYSQKYGRRGYAMPVGTPSSGFFSAVCDVCRFDVESLSMNKFGYWVVRFLLHCGTMDMESLILDEPWRYSYDFLAHPFGNYVLQVSLERGYLEDRVKTCRDVLCWDDISLRNEKSVYNLIKKCFCVIGRVNIPELRSWGVLYVPALLRHKGEGYGAIGLGSTVRQDVQGVG